MKTIMRDDDTVTPLCAGEGPLASSESVRLDQAAAMIRKLLDLRPQAAKVTRLVLVPFVLPWPADSVAARKYRCLLAGPPRAGSTRDTLGRLQAQYWRRIYRTRFDGQPCPELILPVQGSLPADQLHPLAALLLAPRLS